MKDTWIDWHLSSNGLHQKQETMMQPNNQYSIHFFSACPNLKRKVFIKKKEVLSIVILSCIVAYITYKSPIQVDGYYTYLDPLKSLLVSQSIIDYGTIQLDHYVRINAANPHDPRILTFKGHLYYYFPIGTSLFAVPFVWIVNMFGRSMTSAGHEAWMQCVLSSMTVAGFLILSYLLCRRFLSMQHSLLVTLMFTLGTSVISTMGAALWSMNFEVLFILCSGLLLVKDQWSAQNYEAYLLGIVLFSAYLCRPTALTFMLPAGLYVFFKQRAGCFSLCLTCMVLFGIFAAFSWNVYQQLVPPYYLPQRIQQTRTFWIALYGNLFSPARGMLVYNPQMIAILLTGLFFFRRLWKSSFIRISLLCCFLHLIVVSSYPHWWGGGSFGSRLMTDVIPAFLLGMIVMLRIIIRETSCKKQRLLFGIFIVLSFAGGYINTYQGLYNVCTSRWNNFPNIDRFPEYLFYWKYPQFLSTPELLRKKMSDYRNRYPELWTEADMAIYNESDCSKVY